MREILIAEDEELEREAICAIIVGAYPEGIALRRAANGVEALAIAEERKLDAAFLDIRMPGLDGVEAARRIRASSPDLPIVFLTACDSFEHARAAVSLGIDEYILKPATNEEILGALERMLAARRSEAARGEDERARDDAIKSTAEYLRGELRRGLSGLRLDPRCLREYLGIGAPGRGIAFLAAIRLPEGKADGLSQGFRRALLAGAIRRVEESCAGRGLEAVCGASADCALALCLSRSGGGGEDEAKDIVAEAQRRVMGDLGVSLRAGIAFGPAEGLVESARCAAALARDARPLVSAADDCAKVIRSEAARTLAAKAAIYMEESIGKDISLEATAAMLRVSPAHLSRALSRARGSGFSETLALMRVGRAKSLLKSGSSVKEAAALVGFKDPAYFARVFRRLAGTSPTEFLEQAEGGAP